MKDFTKSTVMVDPVLKKESEMLFENLGLDIDSAINMFFN